MTGNGPPQGSVEVHQIGTPPAHQGDEDMKSDLYQILALVMANGVMLTAIKAIS